VLLPASPLCSPTPTHRCTHVCTSMKRTALVLSGRRGVCATTHVQQAQQRQHAHIAQLQLVRRCPGHKPASINRLSQVQAQQTQPGSSSNITSKQVIENCAPAQHQRRRQCWARPLAPARPAGEGPDPGIVHGAPQAALAWRPAQGEKRILLC